MTSAGLDLTGSIACHIPSSCSSVSCCVGVSEIRRSLYTAVDLNTCQYTLTVTIEELQHDIPLLNYKWGKNVMLIKKKNVGIHIMLSVL